MQRIGELATAKADVHALGLQRRGLAFATKVDVLEQQMGRGRETVVGGVKGEVVVGITADPLADLRCTPARLNQKIAGHNRQQQGDRDVEQHFSNQFHGLPSR